jgi:hypothetical protein
MFVVPRAGGGEVVEGVGDRRERERFGAVVAALGPELGQCVSDLAAAGDLLPVRRFIGRQHGAQHDVADEGAADVEHALVGRRERAAAGVADGEAQVALVEAAEILRQRRLLLQLLGRRGGGVVDGSEFAERSGHRVILARGASAPAGGKVARRPCRFANRFKMGGMRRRYLCCGSQGTSSMA